MVLYYSRCGSCDEIHNINEKICLMEAIEMTSKTIAVNKHIAYRDSASAHEFRVALGTAAFVVAFVVLAYVIGSADIAVNPLVPSNVLPL